MKNQRLYDKLVAKVSIDAVTGCWNWTGARRKSGHWSNRYGMTGCHDGIKFRSIATHRAMMFAIHGPFPKEKIVCHRCDNVLCCNPDHLWIGTNKENTLDSVRKRRHHEGQKTHCFRGHPLVGDNIRSYPSKPGVRVCQACMRLRWRASHGWPESLLLIDKLPMGREIDKDTGEISKIEAAHRFGARWKGKKPQSVNESP
jgi:hypothetical protein